MDRIFCRIVVEHSAVRKVRSDLVSVFRAERLFFVTRTGIGEDNVVGNVSRAKGRGQKLRSQHVHVVGKWQFLHLAMKVRDGGGGIAARCNAESRVLNSLEELKV